LVRNSFSRFDYFVVDVVLLMGVEPNFHAVVKEDKPVTIQKSLQIERVNPSSLAGTAHVRIIICSPFGWLVRFVAGS